MKLIPKCKTKKAAGSETEKLPVGCRVDGCSRLASPGAPRVVWWTQVSGVPADRLLIDIY